MISIIIPFYNKKRTIDRAIESVINQTFDNWEIIIIDDFSDEVIQLKESWKKYRIQLIRNEKNLGPGPSRQLGMEVAQGNFLAFLDADDWWEGSFLEESVQVLKENPGIAGTWAKALVHQCNSLTVVKKNNDLNHSNILETLISYGHPWATSSFVWVREFTGSWNNLSTNQDSWFEFRTALKNNKVVKIEKILVNKDECQQNHRIDLISQDQIEKNRFLLYTSIISECWQKLDFNLKIKGVNRIAWVLIRNPAIGMNTQEKKMLHDLRKRSVIFLLIQAHRFFPKVIYAILQKTKFKIF